MDFNGLNRRQLQSLCKLNKIPANITNVAMVDALKSLETVAGIEYILNPSLSETGSSIESPEKVDVMSPRVSRTSCRTSTRLKVQKTPAAARRISMQKETTVQRVYNTRRSARLTEKKHAVSGVLKKETSQPVKIGSFFEDEGETSELDFSHSGQEKSVEPGDGSIETSNESSVSSDNLEYTIGEGSVGNFDDGDSNEKVDDICNALENLDGVVDDESDQTLMSEKDLQMGSAIESEEKVQLAKSIEQHVNVVNIEETNISNTDDLVFVNHIEQESSIDFEAHVEAQSSIVDTVVDTMHIGYGELDVKHEQLHQETEPKIVDADEVTHDPEADFSFNTGKNESSNKGNEVIDNQTMKISYEELDVNHEQINQETEPKIIDADEVTHDPKADFSFNTEKNESLNKGINEVIDNHTMQISYEELDVNHVEINQETELKLVDADEVKHDPKADFSFNTEKNESLNKGNNEVIDNHTMQISYEELDVNHKQINQETEQEIVDADEVTHDSVADFLFDTEDNELSNKSNEVIDNKTMHIAYEELFVNHEQLNQETEQKTADPDFSFMTKENDFLNRANDVNDNQTLSNSPVSAKVLTPISVNNENSETELQGALEEEDKSIDLTPDINSEQRLDQETENKIDDADFSFTEEQNEVLNKANDAQISGNNENIETTLQIVGVEEDKGIEKAVSLNDISMRQLKKKLKALSIKNNKDDKVVEARPALQVVIENQLAIEEEN